MKISKYLNEFPKNHPVPFPKNVRNDEEHVCVSSRWGGGWIVFQILGATNKKVFSLIDMHHAYGNRNLQRRVLPCILEVQQYHGGGSKCEDILLLDQLGL